MLRPARRCSARNSSRRRRCLRAAPSRRLRLTCRRRASAASMRLRVLELDCCGCPGAISSTGASIARRSPPASERVALRVGAEDFVEIGSRAVVTLRIVASGNQREIVEAVVGGDASIQRGLAHGAFQRRVAAVAGPEDADLFRLGDALGNRPARRIREVVLHPAAPLAEARVRVVARHSRRCRDNSPAARRSHIPPAAVLPSRNSTRRARRTVRRAAVPRAGTDPRPLAAASDSRAAPGHRAPSARWAPCDACVRDQPRSASCAGIARASFACPPDSSRRH